MQLPIYIFSAKQGMQWLSGVFIDVVRLIRNVKEFSIIN